MSSDSNHPFGKFWSRYQQYLVNLLLLIATLAFLVGIWAPMLTLSRLVLIQNTFSILSGIGQLFLERDFILFTLIATFTLVFPVLKIGLLFYAWNRPHASYEKSLRWMGTLGKWSMLDVFVVAILITSVKLGALASIQLHYGLYLFSASVVLIMLINHIVHRRVLKISHPEHQPQLD